MQVQLAAHICVLVCRQILHNFMCQGCWILRVFGSYGIYIKYGYFRYGTWYIFNVIAVIIFCNIWKDLHKNKLKMIAVWLNNLPSCVKNLVMLISSKQILNTSKVYSDEKNYWEVSNVVIDKIEVYDNYRLNVNLILLLLRKRVLLFAINYRLILFNFYL